MSANRALALSLSKNWMNAQMIAPLFFQRMAFRNLFLPPPKPAR